MIVMALSSTKPIRFKRHHSSAGYKIFPCHQFVGIWCVRVPMALIFTYVFKLDVIFIWLSMAADQIFKFAVSALVYKVKRVDEIAES